MRATPLAAILSLTATLSFGQFVPELLYFHLNEGAGTTVVNSALPGAGIATATINGGITFGPGMAGTGLVGAALASATNNVATNFNLANLNGQSWTLEFWFKNAAASGTLYHLGQQSSSGFRIFSGGAGANMVISGTSLNTITIAGVPAVGASAHYAFVYNSTTNAMTSYMNGIPTTTVTETTVPALTGSLILLGNATSSGTNGTLDEVRLWQQARSATDIALSYNVELTANNLFSATTTGGGAGDLTLSLSLISPTAATGFLLLTADATHTLGSGPLVGIYPDGLTWGIFSQPVFPGNPLHFPLGYAGYFPDQPFSVPTGTLSFLAGQTWDGVVVMINGSGGYDGRSNVQRLAF